MLSPIVKSFMPLSAGSMPSPARMPCKLCLRIGEDGVIPRSPWAGWPISAPWRLGSGELAFVEDAPELGQAFGQVRWRRDETEGFGRRSSQVPFPVMVHQQPDQPDDAIRWRWQERDRVVAKVGERTGVALPLMPVRDHVQGDLDIREASGIPDPVLGRIDADLREPKSGRRAGGLRPGRVPWMRRCLWGSPAFMRGPFRGHGLSRRISCGGQSHVRPIRSRTHSSPIVRDAGPNGIGLRPRRCGPDHGFTASRPDTRGSSLSASFWPMLRRHPPAPQRE
jgi:hypothetical protein